MNTLELTIAFGAMLLSAATPLLGESELTVEAEIISRKDDRCAIFLRLSTADASPLTEKYNVFHKLSKPDDQRELSMVGRILYDVFPKKAKPKFSLIGQFLQPNDVKLVEEQLFMAKFAGFDNAGLETELDALLEGKDKDNPLAKKLLQVLNSDLSEEEKVFLAKSFPQVEMTLGTGFVSISPLGFNSFEIRNVDDGSVVGSATIEAKKPVYLPAVGKVERHTPKNDTRSILHWSLSKELECRSSEIAGYNIYRVPAESWETAMKEPIPLDMSREYLISGVDLELVYQINDDLEKDTHFEIENAIKDANVVYFVAAVNDEGTVGFPSRGLAQGK